MQGTLCRVQVLYHSCEYKLCCSRNLFWNGLFVLYAQEISISLDAASNRSKSTLSYNGQKISKQTSFALFRNAQQGRLALEQASVNQSDR